MPTTFPGLSITKAREILQQTDKIIRTFPEVESVFGKIGRAETATDPAPLSMIETTIVLKDPGEWRPGLTREDLVAEMDRAIQIPGLTNAWTMPIKTRIDMLSTGIKTPVGIKIGGPDLRTLERLAEQVESVVKPLPGTRSAYAERVLGGSYLDFDIDREAAARFGLRVQDIQDVIRSAVGGMNVSWTVEGLERYPINLRYPRELRDSPKALEEILVATPGGGQIPLRQVARLEVREGPPGIKSEAARPNAWIYVDLSDVDVGTWVERARQEVVAKVDVPPGYTIFWSGQYEAMQRAKARLAIIVPMTLALIVLILYVHTKSLIKTGIVLSAIPFSLVGSVWLMDLMGYSWSVAVAVGLIALAGLAAENGVVMLLYLDLAYESWRERGRMLTLSHLREAVDHGAVRRIRPKLMTVAATFCSLVPILWSTGTGSDVMKRIAGTNGGRRRDLVCRYPLGVSVDLLRLARHHPRANAAVCGRERCIARLAVTWRRRSRRDTGFWRRRMSWRRLPCWLAAACWCLMAGAPVTSAQTVPGEVTGRVARSESGLRLLDPPAGPGAMAPNLGVTVDDVVLLTWLEPTGSDGHRLLVSRLEGDSWSPATEVVRGSDFFANWADLPQIARAVDGTLFVHWLDKLGDDTYAYGARLSRSRDGGDTWEAMGLLHDDASPTEHGFVSYAALPNGDIQAFWLDGRSMLDGGSMHLRTTSLSASSSKAGTSTLLDERVCECCATDAVVADSGPLVVYRDRSDSEIRDIAVVRAVGDRWSEPTTIADDGWEINGCPVNGPAAATRGDVVAVAWFTGAGGAAQVRAALSTDGGATFAEPLVIDDEKPLGRADVTSLGEGDFAVSWLGRSDGGAEIRWRRLEKDGSLGAVQTVTLTTARRSAGVPKMVSREGELLFVWVADDQPSRLRAGLTDAP